METCLTIYVTFEGLGFGCFNQKRGGAEIGFLRLADHNLKIKISGDDGRHQVFDNIADTAKIELTSSDSVVTDFKLNNDGAFDRALGLDPRNDQFDLRWLVDFERGELHTQPASVRRKPPARERAASSVRALTEMFLPHAYFFTEQILTSEYKIEESSSGTTGTKKRPFGLIGDTLGARVDAVKASLQIDGKNLFQFDLGVEPQQVTRFFVTITNTCQEPLVQPQSDFYKYYEVLDFQDGKKFDFDLAASTKGKRPAICEFTLLSQTTSLTEFFDEWSSMATGTESE